jgi:hypothetical protein
LDFAQKMTDPENPINVPKLFFARLKLGTDPRAVAGNTALPYDNLPHIQNCIDELLRENKATKTVDRSRGDDVFYKSLMDGLYLAEREAVLYFAFPAEVELNEKHSFWWHSAV